MSDQTAMSAAWAKEDARNSNVVSIAKPRNPLAMVPNVSGQVPPNDCPREDRLITTLMAKHGSLDDCADILKQEHFFNPANGFIYRAMIELRERNQEYGFPDVFAHWRATNSAHQYDTGIDSPLGQLKRLGNEEMPHVDRAITLEASTIRDLYRQRTMIQVAHRIAALGYVRTPDIQEYLDESLYEVEQAAEPPTIDDMGTAAELAAGAIEWFNEAMDREGAMRGIPTQLRQVDGTLGGLISGTQIIWAGRPSQGKTASACQIAMNTAVQADKDGVRRNGVLFFSLETTKENLTARMHFTISGMSGNDEATGKLADKCARDVLKRCNAADREFYQNNPEELRRAGKEEAKARWNEAATLFASLPINVLYKPAMTVADMWRTIRHVRSQWKKQGIRLALVIVDYLQLMSGRNLLPNGASREQEVGAIALKTREMAQKENFPLLALAQLNRAVEKQKDKRPTLADLRESGQIEMHADTVVFCHREEHYFREECDPEFKDLAEFIVAKNKNGPTRTAWCGFHGPTMTFIDTPKSDERGYREQY